MIETITQIDGEILLFFNGLRAEGLDHFVKAFSGRLCWVPLYLAIAATMVRCYGWKRGLMYVLAVAAAVGLADFVTASMIRPLVHRMRPSNPENPLSAAVQIVDGYRSGRYGFPSCHAANTFALAVASALLMRCRAYTVFIFLWALCQCYSRMYLGVHYPGDLLVGAALGSAIGCGAYLLVRKYDKGFAAEGHKNIVALPLIIVGVATTIILLIMTND